MLSSLRKDFTGRARHQPFDVAITLKPRGLVFGIGTVLVPFARDARVSLDADAAANDRLVALLAVAGRGRLPAGCVTQVGKALDEWSRGDKALAAIRLAFARLPACPIGTRPTRCSWPRRCSTKACRRATCSPGSAPWRRSRRS